LKGSFVLVEEKKQVRNGREYIEFNGNRNKADILAFARETHDETAWKKSNGPLTEEEEKDLVTVLDEKNFDAAMSADPSVTWVVDFYAPWCAHCKKLAPEWAKAAALVARNRRANVRFGKVDVDKNDPLSERFNVKGLPTVLKLKGGASELFVGKREAAALAEWAIEPMSGPAQPEDVPISSAQFDNEFRGKGQTWLLVFTAQWCSHCRAFKPVFRSIKQKVPSGVRAYLVDADDSSDLVDTFAVTELPTILLVKDGKGIRRILGIVFFC
jgi:protein disulfide-isomerase A6